MPTQFDPAAAPSGIELDTETMTAADAKERLEAVTSSRDFGKRLMGGDKQAAKTLDFLQRRSLDIPDEPKPPTEAEQTLNRDVPASPADYHLNFGAELSESEGADRDLMLAAAHGLGMTAGGLQGVIDMAQADARLGHEPTYDRCETVLRKAWGKDFEANNAILHQALRELQSRHPKFQETLLKYPALSNSPTLMCEIVHRAKMIRALRK